MNKIPNENVVPPSRGDWICQRELADELCVSERTASIWASAGKLRQFEHGCRPCGRRKYSRKLVERKLAIGWAAAVERQQMCEEVQT